MGPEIPYTVESRSFDGRSTWQWQAAFTGKAPSLLIVHANAGDNISSGERNYPWPDDTLQFYWSDRWYNIRAALRDGEPYFYSCNVAMPAAFSEGKISYIDLDLEIAVTEGMGLRVEGEEDFQRNAIAMHYPPDIIRRAQSAVQEVQSLVRAGRPPFRNYESLVLKRAT